MVDDDNDNEIKVNNMTPDNVQNLIYPLVVFKFDPIEPKLLLKSQSLLKISSKCIFYCLLSLLH